MRRSHLLAGSALLVRVAVTSAVAVVVPLGVTAAVVGAMKVHTVARDSESVEPWTLVRPEPGLRLPDSAVFSTVHSLARPDRSAALKPKTDSVAIKAKAEPAPVLMDAAALSAVPLAVATAGTDVLDALAAPPVVARAATRAPAGRASVNPASANPAPAPSTPVLAVAAVAPPRHPPEPQPDQQQAALIPLPPVKPVLPWQSEPKSAVVRPAVRPADGMQLASASSREVVPPREEPGAGQSMLAALRQKILPSLADPARDDVTGSITAYNNPNPPREASRTAVYDITSHTVHLPSGERLEAHSGLGMHFDNPDSMRIRMRGVTPPNLYSLTMREALFHGVAALRLNPVDGSRMFGRDGILAHSYMLGPRGESNGCVSFRDYARFLQAFRRGEVNRILVVERVNGSPASMVARLGTPERFAANGRSAAR